MATESRNGIRGHAEFGRMVADLVKARVLREWSGTDTPGRMRDAVQFDVDLTVTPPGPDLPIPEMPPSPDPDDIDICWEICPQGNETFIGCYFDCSADLPDLDGERILPCVRLRLMLDEAADVTERIAIVVRMLREGCITKEQLSVAVVGLPEVP